MKRLLLLVLLAATGVAGATYAGLIPGLEAEVRRALHLSPVAAPETAKPAKKAADAVAPPPAVTVARAAVASFTETVLVTGSLVPREEILVAPEVDGLRVMTLEADEGDRVRKGQVLARLVKEQIEAQLAQNEASLARNAAAVAQARSQIVQAEARLDEAKAAFERAQPLRKSGALSESVFEQREAAARTAEAQLTSARDGLKATEAERTQIEAQRRELDWRRGNTEVTAPRDGLVSRRSARVGATASAAGEPMFRIIAGGEVELEAEVPEDDIARIKEGQIARLTVAGGLTASGKVRLVPSEVDRTTRLGKVRVFLGADPTLRIGTFARGQIETATGTGLAVPRSAVLYGEGGASVQLVRGEIVVTTRVETGLAAGGLVEIRSGIAEGDLVVAKAGTFLRNGDRVRPVVATPSAAKVSEVN